MCRRYLRMMLTKIGILTILVTIGLEHSRARAEQPSPLEQALSAKLMAEFNAGISCTAQAVALQSKLDAALKELDDLKAKGTKK